MGRFEQIAKIDELQIKERVFLLLKFFKRVKILLRNKTSSKDTVDNFLKNFSTAVVFIFKKNEQLCDLS